MHDSSPPTHPLARRLLLSLGLVSVSGSGCIWLLFPGVCDEDPVQVTLDLDAMPEGDTGAGYSERDDCPTGRRQIDDLAELNETYVSGEEVELISQDGRLCTYEYTPNTCCGYGRPYLDRGGRPVEAPTTSTPAWATDAPRPSLDGLSQQQRAALARFWEKNARAEHSSIAGFHRFALELLSHGAPPELVARAQAGAAQELHHARLCFALASTFAGGPIGPAAMRLGDSAPLAADLAQLAAWTLRDGAIGETIAAFLAQDAMEQATDPVVRAVLATIVQDETEHAALAWSTLQWALAVGGAPVREAVAEVLAQLQSPHPHVCEDGLAVPSHGLPSPHEEVALAKRCVAEVVLPVARALLASQRTPRSELASLDHHLGA